MLLCALASAAPAQAGSPFSFGFYDNSPGWGTRDTADNAFAARRVGGTVHRISIRWDGVEPVEGQWRLAPWDEIYHKDLAMGVRPILNIASAPDWARDPSVDCSGDPYCNYPPRAERMDAWREVIRKLLTRYPGMAGLEIWNEPNLPRYWQSGPDPVRYTGLVKEAYRVAREVGSTVPIIAGSLSNYPGPDNVQGIGTASFLDAMFRAGIAGYMDGLSIHPYPDDIDLWRTFRTLSEVLEVRTVHADDTPLWIGELGVTTSGYMTWAKVSENDQGVLLAKLITYFRHMPEVRGMLVQTLYEPTQWGMESSERGLGVIRSDGRPKPAYCAIGSANNTGYRCPLLVKNPVAKPDQAEKWRAQELLQKAADAARAYRAERGAYAGLTPAELHAREPQIAPYGPNVNMQPGPGAYPWEVHVSVSKPAGGVERLLLCNTSRSDRSYCIYTAHREPWRYGNYRGTITQTTHVVVNGWSNTW